MSILIIGLGSMGSRRVRCLQSLGYTDIYGYDINPERRVSASEKYGINIGFCEKPDTVFLSIPPSLHAEYASRYKDIPCFVEAGTEKLEHGSPSATMMYHPAIKLIQQNLTKLGKILNITYHSGQYLPDWHPYEKVADFYVSEVGAKEMVAFELTWFCQLFGLPNEMLGMRRNITEIEGLKAPDTYCLMMQHGECISSIMIDVVSRNATRRLVVNGSDKQLTWDWNADFITIGGENTFYDNGTAADGYNKNIGEQMYIDETKAFIEGTLQNSIEYNNKIIRILHSI